MIELLFNVLVDVDVVSDVGTRKEMNFVRLRCWASALNLYVFAVTLCGLSTTLLPSLHLWWHLFVYAAVFGLGMGMNYEHVDQISL